jgi:hypothetical protein
VEDELAARNWPSSPPGKAPIHKFALQRWRKILWLDKKLQKKASLGMSKKKHS